MSITWRTADVFFHVREPDRTQAHRPPAGKPGPDSEIDPPRRQFVRRSEGVRRDWCKPVRRDQDSGAEPDLGRLDRRGCHSDKRVGAQHLRVVEPGARKTELLSPPHDAPGIGVDWWLSPVAVSEQPPARFQRQGYVALARKFTPQGAHYLENHRGHLMFVKSEERPFVTAELIRRTTYTATAKELKERFAAIAEAGFTEVAIQIVPGQEHAIEDWGRIRRAFA